MIVGFNCLTFVFFDLRIHNTCLFFCRLFCENSRMEKGKEIFEPNTLKIRVARFIRNFVFCNLNLKLKFLRVVKFYMHSHFSFWMRLRPEAKKSSGFDPWPRNLGVSWVWPKKKMAFLLITFCKTYSKAHCFVCARMYVYIFVYSVFLWPLYIEDFPGKKGS